MTEKRWLGLILLLFVMLGVTYALLTPAFEASDELWHYPMVRHLADGNPLPVQVFDPALAGPWKQEASQPPLYYYAAAALTFWIDTADMPEVRRENPHVDNGIITADGNINLVVHDPGANDWQGTLLALRIVRLFSVLLGTLTVYLTYRIASAAAQRPEIALGAAAVNAFLPMFLFISGAVNNDNLAIMLSSLALLLMITAVIAYKSRTPSWLLLGVVIGAALLTKEGTIGLIPMAWGTAVVVAWQERQHERADVHTEPLWRYLAAILVRSLALFALALIPILLIAGWWYWRNVQLYGDWLGWNAFIAVLGQRGHPASLAQLWGERRGFLMAFWGLFGGVNVPMPGWIYTILNTLLVIAIPGFIFVALRAARAWWRETTGTWSSPRGFIDNTMGFVVRHFAVVASLIFAAAIVFGLIRWATTTWSSQGRLVFTALSALLTLFTLGLVGWLPRRPARWTVSAVAAFMFVIAALAPFLWIKPAYEPETYAALSQTAVFEPTDLNFGGQMALRGIAIESESGDRPLQPGDTVWVHLQWEALTDMDEDWSVFVHAVDPVLGQPIAQRDMYLGQGLQLTSWLETGQQVVNSYRVQVPPTAAAPAQLEIATGLYDYATGERLPLAERSDTAILATLDLAPTPGTFPNPVSVEFEDQLRLLGYELAPRRTTAGETIDLVLHWEAIGPLDTDYAFFAQIVGEDTTRWANDDPQPQLGTSSWATDEVHALDFTLTLADDTPPGLYPVIIGAYIQTEDGRFERLQIKAEDGRLTDDFLELTRVRVD
jgi:hypothetical protein